MSAEVCKHERYELVHKMEIVRLKGLDQHQMILKVTAKCVNCKKNFTFAAQPGFSTIVPSVTSDCSEIRIPVFWPETEDEERETPPPEGYVH